MMHNSLLIRDRLRQRNLAPATRLRRDPHRHVRLDPARTPALDETLITNTWRLQSRSDHLGIDEAISDLQDFFSKLEVPLEVATTPVDNQAIELDIATSAPAHGFRLEVTEQRVTVVAGDIQGLWAGVVHLEREMMQRAAPILPRGQEQRTSAWKVQISQAPYGANYLVPDLSPEYLSDDAFRLLAHYGINGMTLYGDWLCYVHSEQYPELNTSEYEQNIATLRDAAQRALRYGVRFYYVPVSPKLRHDHPAFQRVPELRGAKISWRLGMEDNAIHSLCSSSAESLAFHAETMTNLFQAVPELGGLILIIGGESYYHCYMRPDRTGLTGDVKRQTNCPRCSQIEPEEAVNLLVEATAKAVHAVSPHAPVMAWPYSAFHCWSNDPAVLNYIAGMPPDAALLSEIDKDQWAAKDGYQKHIWDYSIDYIGPKDYILQQAVQLEQQQMDLFVKMETALGLECVQLPYWPALQRLGQKWRNLASLQPRGTLQSWMFYGMWGSRAEELGWWQAWRPEQPLAETLQRIAERDFGDNAPALIEVWQQMSEAAGRLPYIPRYFNGPEFIGPAHPIFLSEPSPEDRQAWDCWLYYLQEGAETFSRATIERPRSLLLESLQGEWISSNLKIEDGRELWQLIFDEYALAIAASRRAFEKLAALPAPGNPQQRTILTEERLLCEYIYRTLVTVRHTLRFMIMQEAGQPSPEAAAEMRAIAQAEVENAKAARHIYEEAPWLNLQDRIDGGFPSSLTMIDTKIRLMQEALQATATSR